MRDFMNIVESYVSKNPRDFAPEEDFDQPLDQIFLSNPLDQVFYHGGYREFETFNAPEQGWRGIHWTNDLNSAERYARKRAEQLNGTPVVYAAHLMIKKPLYTNATNDYRAAIEYAKKRGYDAVVGPTHEGNDAKINVTIFRAAQTKLIGRRVLIEEQSVTEGVAPQSEITRWVNAKGALAYIRSNAMIGRVRHWLPKQLSGLDKIYPKTGLSFGIPNSRSNWNAHSTDGICFVVDRTQLSNLVCNIDGNEVYTFTYMYDDLKRGIGFGTESVKDQLKQAIQSSLEHPDEAFVIGDIRNLASVLVRIVVGKNVPPAVVKKIQDYGEGHDVPVVRDK